MDCRQNRIRPKGAGLFIAVVVMMSTCMVYADSLLPPLDRQQGPGAHWTLQRTVDANTVFGLDKAVTLEPGKPSMRLHVRSAGDGSYAELRVHPLLKLKSGQEYVFSVWVRGRATRQPHIEVYGFDEAGRPTRLARGSAPVAGHFDWQLIHTPFVVPADVVQVRLGMGIAQATGNLWFAEPELQQAGQSTSVMPDAASPILGEDSWTAKWIWVYDTFHENQITFERSLHFDIAPTSAIVQVTADDSYELYINGDLVGLDSHWRSVELYDISKYLRQGENQIKLATVNFGGPGGALLQGAAFFPDGEVQHFGTDGKWSSFVPAINREARTFEFGPPPVEPWGEIPFTRYEPADVLSVQLLEPVPALEPGDVLRLMLRLPRALDEATLDQFELTFTDADSLRRHPLSVVPPRLELRPGNALMVEAVISRFAAEGEYQWRMEAPGCVLTSPDSSAHRIQVLESHDLPKPSGTIWPGVQTNRIAVGNSHIAPVLYSTMTPSAQRFINWRVTDSHLYEVYGTFGSIWSAPGTYDIAGLEREIMQILEADPDASIYLKLTTDMPSWWLRENPDDRFLSSSGWPGLQSFASDAWRRDTTDAIVDMIALLRDRPVGRYLSGVVLMGFRGGEFQLWGENTAEYDVSPVARAAFAAWQRGQGYDELVDIPHPALKIPFEPGHENAEVRRRFFRFVADRAADNLVFITSRLKERLPELSLALYYGYLTEHAAVPQRLFFSGHLGIERVLREAPIDMIGGPASYQFRGVGQPTSFMYPEGSASLHGITPLVENDLRTYLVHPGSSDASDGLLTSFVELEKLRLLAASRGAGVRYLGLFNTVDFFQSPPLLLHTAAWNRRVQMLEHNPPGANGEVALLLDPSVLIGATELPDVKTMVPTFLHRVRGPLSRTGRPYTQLLLSDWAERRDTWDTVVVPLPALLDGAARDALASAFGALPEIRPSDGLLVLSRGPVGAFVTSDLDELRRRLATPEARAAGPDTVWYVGGNFHATITGNRVQLHRD